MSSSPRFPLSRRILLWCALLALLLILSLPQRPAKAAGIIVNVSRYEVQTDTYCTLPEAILNANADSDVTGGDCAAGSGPYTITFANSFTADVGLWFVYPGSTLIAGGKSGLPDITSDITDR